MAIPWIVTFNHADRGEISAINAIYCDAFASGLVAIAPIASIIGAVESILTGSPTILAIAWRAETKADSYRAAIAVSKSAIIIAPARRYIPSKAMACDTRRV